MAWKRAKLPENYNYAELPASEDIIDLSRTSRVLLHGALFFTSQFSLYDGIQ